jgi:hypothetical protein
MSASSYHVQALIRSKSIGALLFNVLQLAQVLEALVQEAEAVQKHKPQLHALYLQDAPAALADACSSTPGAASLAGGVDQASLAMRQALHEVVAGSSAAALAMINAASSTGAGMTGSSAGRLGEPSTPSSGGGLFGGGGGKLLDVLLGRKNSAGLGEVDRAMTISSSRRTSQDCSRAATPQHSTAPQAGVGLHGLSRGASDAATPVACNGTGCSRQLGSCCSSRCQTPSVLQGSCLHQLAGAVDGAIAEMADEGCEACAAADPTSTVAGWADGPTEGNATSAAVLAAAACSCAAGCEVASSCDNEGGGCGAKAKARASLPGAVAEKFYAVVELLHKLGPDRDRAQ